MSTEEERQFLHDISNPLSISYGNIKVLLMRFEKNKPVDHETLISKLQKSGDALQRVSHMVDERRKALAESGRDT